MVPGPVGHLDEGPGTRGTWGGHLGRVRGDKTIKEGSSWWLGGGFSPSRGGCIVGAVHRVACHHRVGASSSGRICLGYWV